MSFRCEECGQVQPKRSKPIKKVVERRYKAYPERFEGEDLIDPGGFGQEIVKEILICSECSTSE